jgi:hypothetical protein
MGLSSIRKALVPVAVAIVIWLLQAAGMEITTELQTQIVLVITAIVVYFVPNAGSGEGQ